MKFDDLIGLLFVLFFIVVPVLKGLFQREAAPEAPLFEEDLPEPEPAPQPEPKRPERVPTRPVVVAPKKKAEEPPAAEEPLARPQSRPKKPRLRFDRDAIVEGIVWHEILSEPRAKRRWQPKR